METNEGNSGLYRFEEFYDGAVSPVDIQSLGVVSKYSSANSVYDDHFTVVGGGGKYHFKNFDTGKYGGAYYEPLNELISRRFARELNIRMVEPCVLATYKDSLGIISNVSYETTLSQAEEIVSTFSSNSNYQLMELAIFSCFMFDYDWGKGKKDCYSCKINSSHNEIFDIKRYDFSHSLNGAYGEIINCNIDYASFKRAMNNGTGLDLLAQNPTETLNLLKKYQGLSARRIHQIISSIVRYYKRSVAQYDLKIDFGNELIDKMTLMLLNFKNYTAAFVQEKINKYGC